jgi:hypothetical protein
MSKSTTDNWIASGLLGLIAIPVLYLSLGTDFIRESGDNIYHYYFAKYAFQDPMLFFDHWAKPVFTLLTSPFAQFGFKGMKLFNGLTGLGTAWIAFLIAKQFQFRYAWLAIPFVLFAPTYFTLLFSGYTEPLFGLFMVTGVYFVLRKKYVLAAILFSFLPYVRTEGVFIAAILGAYFLWIRQWKQIPLLLTGSFILTLIGWLMGKEFLWILNEVPYSVRSIYGEGKLSFYAEQWILAAGIPLGISCIAGLLLLLHPVFDRKKYREQEGNRVLYFLAPAFFLAYFMFHTLSWHLGLFGALGMIRILIPLIPLAALFSLFALQYLLLDMGRTGKIIAVLFIAFVVIFPFLHNPASINFRKDFSDQPELLLMNQIGKEIKTEFPNSPVYYSDPYFHHVLGINPFKEGRFANFTEFPLTQIPLHAIIIWDNRTSNNFTRFNNNLEENPDFKLIRSYKNSSQATNVTFRTYYRTTLKSTTETQQESPISQ